MSTTADALAAQAAAPITLRRVTVLALPMIVSNITVPLMGIVDTTVMGHQDAPEYLGAVALGSLLFVTVFFLFNFLRFGTTGLASQAYGARQADEVLAVLARGVGVGFLLGLAVIAFAGPIAWVGFQILKGSPEVDALAREYFAIRVWGLPASLATMAVLGWLIGLQRTDLAFIQQTVVNGANAVLNVVLVFGVGMDVDGVALASVIAEWGGLVLAFVLVRRKLAQIDGVWSLSLILAGDRLRRLFAVNRDIFIRTALLETAFLVFSAIGARMGDVTLAANAILLNFLILAAFSLDGFAHVVETLVGHAVGARDPARLRRAFAVCVQAAVMVATATTALFAVGGGLMIDLMTGLEDVRAEARTYVLWAAMLPLAGVYAWMLDGAFLGATRGRDIRIAMFQALLGFLVAVALLATIFDNHGLWLSLNLFVMLRAWTLHRRYPALLADTRPA